MKDYTELKTFEQACKLLGLDLKKVLPDFSSYPERHRKSTEAYSKIVLLVEAANKLANNNKTWIPDYEDINQYKYEAWFIYDKGSSGFRYYYCDDWSATSGVGSRLCFVSIEVCKYITTQFAELFNDWLK